MLLALANNLRQADQQVRQKIWEREANRGWELKGKTIGIIGFGYTGEALAKRLAGFDMKVLVYDKYKKNYATHLPHVEEVEMPSIFEQADIVSFHLPLTPETIGLANKMYWQKFNKKIVVVNTARGAVIPTSDLLAGLDERKILGACLDVFENEKPNRYSEKEKKQYENLFIRPNVILTPHIAGWTKESKQRLAQLLLHRILNQ
jgi:D-3-phosphoglycerate dehydrogenase